MKILFRLFAFFLVLIFLALGLIYATPLPGNIPVLMYHYIGTEEDTRQAGGLYVSEKSFARQMAFLKFFGYRVISMDDYYQIKAGAKRPQGREVLITFDDGHDSFETKALPILDRYKFPATMFLIAGKVPSGENDSLDPQAVRKILKQSPWIDFQAHTKTHPHLHEISEPRLKEELFVAKRELEELIEKPIYYLAYPYGNFNERVLNAVAEAGYKLAFTTSHKKLGAFPEGPFSQTRIKVHFIADNPIVFWSYVSGFYHGFKGLLHQSKIKH